MVQFLLRDIYLKNVQCIAQLSSRNLSNDKPMAAVTSIVQTSCCQIVTIEFTNGACESLGET